MDRLASVKSVIIIQLEFFRHPRLFYFSYSLTCLPSVFVYMAASSTNRALYLGHLRIALLLLRHKGLILSIEVGRELPNA